MDGRTGNGYGGQGSGMEGDRYSVVGGDDMEGRRRSSGRRGGEDDVQRRVIQESSLGGEVVRDKTRAVCVYVCFFFVLNTGVLSWFETG